MIEVEKKFGLAPDLEARLIVEAQLLGRQANHDRHLDTSDYRLTQADYWLRERNGRFELKLPLNTRGKTGRTHDQYHELETEPEIRTALKLATTATLTDDLDQAGYQVFADITTHRTTYEKDGCTIDIDTTDFGYHVVEIEKLVATEAEMADAVTDILRLAQELHLPTAPTRGKTIEYIYRNNPEQYQVLIDAQLL